MIRHGRPSVSVLALIGIPLATLGGCSRPYVSPLAVPPYRDQSSAPYDRTWIALVRALAMDNVPLRALAKDSGVIATDDFTSPIGVYADCGRVGDVLVEGEALVAFTVFVRPTDNGGSELQVNAKMRTVTYRKGSSGKPKSDPIRQCASTGRWEANLADAVRRLVKE
jgi:hypothetical protein